MLERFRISHPMRLVSDHHIDHRPRFLESFADLFRPSTLVGNDPPEWIRLTSLTDSISQLRDVGSLYFVKMLFESISQLTLPLALESGRNDHKHMVNKLASFELPQDVASLNCLPEAHVICDQNSIRRVIKKLQKRFELMSIKLC